MKKLMSRALTLVIIAGTISNVTHCLPPKAVNTAVTHEKKVNAANMAVAAARDKGASQEEQSKKEEAAKKAADEARTWLNSVNELSTSTKVLLGTIATTGALIGVDYAIAKYTGDRMQSAKALEAARTAAEPYMENIRQQATKAGKYIQESGESLGKSVRGSRLNPSNWNWRKPATVETTETIITPAPQASIYHFDDERYLMP